MAATNQAHWWALPRSPARRLLALLMASLTIGLLLGVVSLVVMDLAAVDPPCTYISISASIASVGTPGCPHYDHHFLGAGLMLLLTCPLAFYLTGRAAGWPIRGTR